jgi:hypothetical protein
MAIEVINIPIDTWIEIGYGDFSFQALGDRGVYYTEATSTPIGKPPQEVPARFALSKEKVNYRSSTVLSRLFVHVSSNNGTNIAIDKPTYQDVYQQDQTTFPVEHWLTYQQEAVTILENIAIDDNTVVLNAGAGATIVGIEGNAYFLEVRYNNPDNPGMPIVRFYQGEIITYTDNVTNVTIELDTPFDFNIDTTYIESVYIVDANASRVSVLATTSNRLSMCVYPPDNLSWDLTKVIVSAVLDGQPDDGKFFDNTTPLTWGIYIGSESSIKKKYLVNVKVNADFGASAYDITYSSRTVPPGTFGMRVRKTFGGQGEYGVVVRLNGNTEKFCVYLQENWGLAEVNDCRFKIIGHEVD